jgi:hypothetical protein
VLPAALGLPNQHALAAAYNAGGGFSGHMPPGAGAIQPLPKSHDVPALLKPARKPTRPKF